MKCQRCEDTGFVCECTDQSRIGDEDFWGACGRCPDCHVKNPIIDERHALYAGAVIGMAWKHGIHLHPKVDDDGNYVAAVNLDIGDVCVEIIIPPPPSEWVLSDWMME